MIAGSIGPGSTWSRAGRPLAKTREACVISARIEASAASDASAIGVHGGGLWELRRRIRSTVNPL